LGNGGPPGPPPFLLNCNVLSLVLGVLVLLQASALSCSGAYLGEESLEHGGNTGIWVGLLFLAAGSFAFSLPRVSLWFLILAGLLSFSAGIGTQYKDLLVWGVLSLGAAAMCWRAARQEKKAQNARPKKQYRKKKR